jgi:hypothetical protein
LQRREAFAQGRQRVLREAGADAARIAQGAVGIVHAEQQRADVFAAAGGLGVPDDHELLFGVALELAPGIVAPGDVRRVDAFCDQALEAERARLA